MSLQYNFPQYEILDLLCCQPPHAQGADIAGPNVSCEANSSSGMQTSHLLAKFTVLNRTKVTYVICVDPMRKVWVGDLDHYWRYAN